jgi:hypothetical protein
MFHLSEALSICPASGSRILRQMSKDTGRFPGFRRRRLLGWPAHTDKQGGAHLKGSDAD